MRRRILSLALTLMMILAFVPAAMAEDDIYREELPDGTIYEYHAGRDAEYWIFPDGKRVFKGGSGMIFYDLEADEVLRLDEFMNLIANMIEPNKEIYICPNEGGTIIGKADAVYDWVIIRTFEPVVVHMVDLNIRGITLQTGGTLDVTGACSANYAGTTEPQGVYVAPFTIQGSGTFATVSFASKELELHVPVIVENSNGMGMYNSRVLFKSENAQLDSFGISSNDPRGDPNATTARIIVAKADGVAGAWNVSPRSAIVSGEPTDNEIVVDATGKVSVWLGEAPEPEPEEPEEPEPEEPEEPIEAPNLDDAASWAHTHINEAYAKGFLPEELQAAYTQNITRGEFVRLAMSWLRYETKMTDDELVAAYAKPGNLDRAFADTDDPIILAAAWLDITAGVGGGVFGIDGTFDRQQAAVMLVKVHNIL
ncbi:MAG: hypothetical protein FWG72_10565, partial [Oscillospiraceae bacterium]|nr:hypothetical protein [Oscillospiraceae bacterium]